MRTGKSVIEYRCDFPGCDDSAERINGSPACDWIGRNGIGWEFKCGGQLAVCAKHKCKTCDEIEKLMEQKGGKSD